MKTLSISLTCCRRPEYLQQVLDAISKADKSDIDIKLFTSVDKIDPKVVEIASSYQSVNIGYLNINDPPIGCNQNTKRAIQIAHQSGHSPYILHLEDDTVPTLDCFQFFMYAFEKYSEDPRTISIGGYNKTEDMEDEKIYGTFSEPFFSAWGCGFWSHKLDIIYNNWTPSKINGGVSWDSHLSDILFEKQKYLQVRPTISRIQNIGAEKGTWVMDSMWHYYNHRSPFLSNDFTGNIDWKNYAENN